MEITRATLNSIPKRENILENTDSIKSKKELELFVTEIQGDVCCTECDSRICSLVKYQDLLKERDNLDGEIQNMLSDINSIKSKKNHFHRLMNKIDCIIEGVCKDCIKSV